MNRKIKFRAWHKSTSTMFNVHGWHSEFVFEDTLNGCGTTETNPCKIEYCELMQFTGMVDKNDKEIYEGDIIRVCNNKKSSFEVIFKNAYQGGWNLKAKEAENTISLGAREKSELEIIGNIYQNADILTIKK